MNKPNLILTILFMACFTMQAQEVETFLIQNQDQAVEYAQRKLRLENEFNEKNLIALPFIDDFSQDHFPGNTGGHTVLWENLDTYRNMGFGVDPPSIGVLTFDGLKADGSMHDNSTAVSFGHADTLTSVDIELEGTDNVVLSFYYQPQGNGEAPDGSDSLSLSFYSPTSGQWSRVWHALGSTNTAFQQILLSVDTAYRHDGFKFQFVNYGGLAGSVDVWHLDWIYLDANRSLTDSVINDVGFNRPEYTLLKQEYISVPWTHYQQEAGILMENIKPIQLRNNRSLGAFIDESGYHVDYQGSTIASFTDPQSPSVAAMSDIEIPQEINFAPNDFVYDIAINDTCASFDVTFEFITSPDIHPDNNSYTFTQHLHNYYAYDDGGAERGYGLSGTTSAKLAYRYDILMGDSMRGIQMYLLPIAEDVEDEVLYLRVWEDAGGEPGDLIYEDLAPQELSYSMLNEFVTYEFDSAIFVPAGSVFIGFGQTAVIGSVTTLNLGNDKNRDQNATRLRFDTGNGWSPSSISGTLMIHPVFTSLRDGVVSLESHSVFDTQVKVWPIPASDFLHVKLPAYSDYDFKLIDMQGKTVRKGRKSGMRYSMYIEGLTRGFYMMEIVDSVNGLISQKKVIISE